MKRFLGLLIIGCLLTGVALGEKTSVEAVTGGGSISQAGGYMLNGAIAGDGLPGDVAGLSQGGGFWISVGFYPVLVGQVFAENFADPAWLEIGRALEPIGAGFREMAGLLLRLPYGGTRV